MADQNVYRQKRSGDFLPILPFFLVLLPVFFVLHEFTANYNAVPAFNSIVLCILYIIAAFIFTGIGWLIFRDLHKAALMATMLMSYHFFYGSVRDLIADNFPRSFLLRYRFIIPFTILLFGATTFWLKKRKKPLTRLSTYLSVLLAVLTLYDIIVLSAKIYSRSNSPVSTAVSKVLTPCDTCSKPDIYLIVPDGYPGYEALKSAFNIDNSAFCDELSQRGFHISRDSKSNYNSTLFSIPSLLNMDFISFKKDKQLLKLNLNYNRIRDNIVTKFLTENGYRFYNHSNFDVEKQPGLDHSFFIPTGTEIITSQTFFSRLEKDFFMDLLQGKFGKSLQKKYAHKNRPYNDNVLSLTMNIATQKISSPKFVYAHLMLPHYPFYFDSKGNPAPLEKLEGPHKETVNDFYEYLIFTNKKIVALADHILAASTTPPIIMILSDHGFSHPHIKTDGKYSWSNLNAIYLPGGNYDGFYDGISNVNQFRVLLNTCFNQHIPLSRDTTISVFDFLQATKSH